MLVNVVGLVGGGEDLGFVEIVDAQRLQHLRLHEVADAALGHDGDGDGVHDARDDLRVCHAGNAAGGADVRGYALQCHDGAGASVLGDLGLLRGDDVHDDAAFEHLGQAALDGNGAGLNRHWLEPHEVTMSPPEADRHDDAAFEHLGQAAPDGNGIGLDCHLGATSRWVQYTRKGNRGQGTRTIKGLSVSGLLMVWWLLCLGFDRLACGFIYSVTPRI